MRGLPRTKSIWKPHSHIHNIQPPSLCLLPQLRQSELAWDLILWIIPTVLQDKCTTQSPITIPLQLSGLVLFVTGCSRKESWRGIWKRTSRKSIESVTIALNAQKRALLDMMAF
ncbi:hypothetical protein H9L39_09568 [Fusarium oxysporum f. sp. albedinis]|nr:hypothetical protein FocnCong_v007581 [Fusarium oxysporum f. sp. conglutinans]KAK2480194.1 hypothetical protein H9L39_09568 [Fusarium oxysporum f. sp. albedinis]